MTDNTEALKAERDCLRDWLEYLRLLDLLPTQLAKFNTSLARAQSLGGHNVRLPQPLDRNRAIIESYRDRIAKIGRAIGE